MDDEESEFVKMRANAPRTNASERDTANTVLYRTVEEPGDRYVSLDVWVALIPKKLSGLIDQSTVRFYVLLLKIFEIDR